MYSYLQWRFTIFDRCPFSFHQIWNFHFKKKNCNSLVITLIWKCYVSIFWCKINFRYIIYFSIILPQGIFIKMGFWNTLAPNAKWIYLQIAGDVAIYNCEDHLWISTIYVHRVFHVFLNDWIILVWWNCIIFWWKWNKLFLM
jgi:hypothetical protein